MPKVVLTFDYELFLGNDSGSVYHTLLAPTHAVIQLLQHYNAKAIFFVDASYLLALKAYNHKELKVIASQLQALVALDCSIELHLHPQWRDAVPKGDKWEFRSFEHYRLHSLSREEIRHLFRESICLLSEITGYKPIAFRAGGWSITPFGMLKEAFIENGIKIDMSVLPGFSKDALPLHFYHFLDVPSKVSYRFENEVTQEVKNGSFLEIPVTTFTMYGVDLAFNKILNKINQEKSFGDGKSLPSAEMGGNLLKRLFHKNMRKATIENQSYSMFRKSLHKIENRELLSYVMHPKMLSQTSLKNLEYLLKNYQTLNSKELLKEYF